MTWKEKTKKVSGNQIIDSSITFDNLGCTIDEDNMASNSATHIPTQQSVKAYVDANGGGGSSPWTTTGSDIYYTTGDVSIGTTDITDKLRVSGNVRADKVKIGTNSQLYPLNVDSTTTAAAAKFTSNTTSTYIFFEDTNSIGNTPAAIGAIGDECFIVAGDSERIRIDSSGSVGIGVSDPSRALHIAKASGSTILELQRTDANTNGATGAIQFTASDDHSVAAIAVFGDGDNEGGEISFRTTSAATENNYFNSTTERMRIDSAGNVGIGTSPQDKLHVSTGTDTDSGNIAFTIGGTSTSNGRTASITKNTSTPYELTIQAGNHATSNMETVFKSSDSKETMRIDSSGNVGIGVSDPDKPLEVSGRIHSTSQITVSGDTHASPLSIFSTLAQAAQLESNTTACYIRFDDATSSTAIPAAIGALGNECFIAAGGQERIRIDSSGNVGIGTSDPAYRTHINYAKTTDNTVGLRVSYDSSSFDGKMIAWGEGTNEAGVLGRADGFGLDSCYIASGTTGLRLERTFGTSNRVNPCDNTGALRDNAIDLGGSNARFDDIYATNTSIISSSDRNLKQDIEALSEAELRVALACKGLLRKFRWIDSVEEKGDNARIHFGIIAQDLQDAFTAEGLDAGRYGMFIKETWWEHEGEHYPTAESAPEGADEITRLGVRYSELLGFIIAAL